MQTYIQTFAANTTWQMNVPGKYFVLLQCSLTCNVRFYLGGKKLDMGDITGLLAGLEVGPLAPLNGPNAFDRVEIDVQAGDTVQIGIGNGAARYNRANATVNVTSAVPLALDSATKLALVRPEQETASTNVAVGIAANTPETVILPAGNVNGLVVLSASLNDYAVGIMSGGLYARATAPAAASNAGLIAGVEVAAVDTGNVFHRLSNKGPIFVPAGLGLYWLQSIASAYASAQRSVRYKLL